MAMVSNRTSIWVITVISAFSVGACSQEEVEKRAKELCRERLREKDALRQSEDKLCRERLREKDALRQSEAKFCEGRVGGKDALIESNRLTVDALTRTINQYEHELDLPSRQLLADQVNDATSRLKQEKEQLKDAKAKISQLQDKLEKTEKRVEKLLDLVKRSRADILLRAIKRLEARLASSEEELRRLTEENIHLRDLFEQRAAPEE